MLVENQKCFHDLIIKFVDYQANKEFLKEPHTNEEQREAIEYVHDFLESARKARERTGFRNYLESRWDC